MGQELDCTMRMGRRSLAGRAQLETDYLLFRGEERLKVMLKDLTCVTASDGVLKLEFAGGPAWFELGKAAAKWAEKILHPPSRLDKLGVKTGTAVALVGEFDADFVRELEDGGAVVTPLKEKPGLVFVAAAKKADLVRVEKLASTLPTRGALWVVYPKGIAAIREIEVIESGRGAGLKDVKVAAFSTALTALKFVK